MRFMYKFVSPPFAGNTGIDVCICFVLSLYLLFYYFIDMEVVSEIKNKKVE